MNKYNGYDIYGDRLLKGHCEVHPWVPEVYPCESCIQAQHDHEWIGQQIAEHEAHLIAEYENSLIPDESINLPGEETE